jgi:hypothetical protein
MSKARELLHIRRFLKQHPAHLIIAILYVTSVEEEGT